MKTRKQPGALLSAACNGCSSQDKVQGGADRLAHPTLLQTGNCIRCCGSSIIDCNHAAIYYEVTNSEGSDVMGLQCSMKQSSPSAAQPRTPWVFLRVHRKWLNMLWYCSTEHLIRPHA